MVKLTELDYDPIIQINGNCNNKTGDLYQLSSKIYEKMNIKISLLLFLIYYILNTDVFIERGLTKFFNGVYDNTCDKITERGIIISGILLSIGYLILDFLDKKNIL